VTDTSLADYVLAEITRCCGPQLPCPGQDLILAGFADRWGDQAMDICRQVFGTHNGFWMSAPVTVRRFHHSQDDFFAIPLRAELGASGNNTR
jgi:hypothetical protein